MIRRSFLALLGLAPVVAVAAAKPATSGRECGKLEFQTEVNGLYGDRVALTDYQWDKDRLHAVGDGFTDDTDAFQEAFDRTA